MKVNLSLARLGNLGFMTLKECPKCNGIFNYYKGVSSKGKTSEFVIRIKPKVKGYRHLK